MTVTNAKVQEALRAIIQDVKLNSKEIRENRGNCYDAMAYNAAVAPRLAEALESAIKKLNQYQSRGL